MVREIIFHDDHFMEFYVAQNPKVQEKIDHVLKLVQTLERVPTKFLKHMAGTDGIYEVRVQHSSNIFRIFCFFDDGKLVVLLNGIQKKTQKTPKKEIVKAEKLKEEYFENKKKQN
ncbi:MAG: type II toxin-antitoxin system RelE/ParE family toxin [Crocinitomicaceae bacterium]|nr:type II toxin-antitoxin system RelE/ParE family toxin [Crocinitomicaceae bacterium]MCB9222737.1 type II toxin-antitoxin system RelE/ParE family toxin [Crocinitomicaceae bacterium]